MVLQASGEIEAAGQATSCSAVVAPEVVPARSDFVTKIPLMSPDLQSLMEYWVVIPKTVLIEISIKMVRPPL